jgi:molecular chaperone IbpA
MRYDWTPLWRSTIGFDRLFDVLDEVQRTAEESYPPHNIERLDENCFQISVALAGFTPDEVALTVEHNVLTKAARAKRRAGPSCIAVSRRATSSVSSRWPATSRSRAPLLVIDLVREIPEAMKPRRIAINGAGPSNVTQIEAKAA